MSWELWRLRKLQCNAQKAAADAGNRKGMQESRREKLVLFLQNQDHTPRSMCALYQNLFDVSCAA
jgi:hypothetical protein